jgi:Ca2+-binding RTX toxin-like protein
MTINTYRPRTLLAWLVAAFLAAGLLALVGANPAWAADPSFAPAPNSPFPVGSAPTTVTNADFNGDGKMDLAAQNAGSNTVSVLLGNGDGTFKAKTDFAVGSSPTSVISADFNGDTIADLAVTNQNSGSVSVLLGQDLNSDGKGDGTFKAKQDFPVGSNPTSVIAGHFNDDNADGMVNSADFVDLAVANYSDVQGYGSVSVLLGKGDGTFQPKTDYPVYRLTCNDFLCVSNTAGPNQVITADFNGDTKADLATANISGRNPIGQFGPGGVSVLFGTGNGTFQDAKLATSGTPVTSIDANGTGNIVATYFDSDVVSVLSNNGNGGFSAGGTFPVGDGPSAVTSGDLNGDSVDDLAVSNFNSDSVSVLRGNGGGSFQAAQNFPAGDGPAFVIGAGLNADSLADLAVANQNSNNVSVLLNTIDTTPPDTTAPSITLSTPSNGATYNLNQTVTANYSCQDEAGGSGVASCQGTVPNGSPVDTATSGTKTFTVSASDNAGNISSPVTHTYTVGQCTKTGTSSGETISGTSGVDVICAGGGNDTINGLGGNDTLKGEDGNDTLLGGGGNDALDGGLGTDKASYSASASAVNASLATNSSTGQGSDTFLGLENLLGSKFADTLTGSATNNTLTGGASNDTLKGEDGNDILQGGIGDDSLEGGLGTDKASYSASLTAVSASLATNSATGEGSDTFLGVENLQGSSLEDTLTGSATRNTLTGGGGNDDVVGGGGPDTLKGEDGNDTVNSQDGVSGNDSLDGGAGTDTKVSDATEKSIVNFEVP